jgi:hypothetical protein
MMLTSSKLNYQFRTPLGSAASSRVLHRMCSTPALEPPYRWSNLLTDGEICGIFRFQLFRLRYGKTQFARVIKRAAV